MKRKPIDTIKLAAEAKSKATGQEPLQAASESATGERKETVTTAIHISREHWQLLRAVALARAKRQGGRASVSKLISELVQKHQADLEQEAGRHLELMTID